MYRSSRLILQLRRTVRPHRVRLNSEGTVPLQQGNGSENIQSEASQSKATNVQHYYARIPVRDGEARNCHKAHLCGIPCAWDRPNLAKRRQQYRGRHSVLLVTQQTSTKTKIKTSEHPRRSKENFVHSCSKQASELRLEYRVHIYCTSFVILLRVIVLALRR